MKNQFALKFLVGFILQIFSISNTIAQENILCNDVSFTLETVDCIEDDSNPGVKYFIEDPNADSGIVSIIDLEGSLVKEKNIEFSISNTSYDFIDLDVSQDQKFTVKYTNNINCEVERLISVKGAIDIQYEITHPSCFEEGDGGIKVLSNNTDCSIIWNDGSTDWIRTKLQEGSYTCHISNESCSFEKVLILHAPQELKAIISPATFTCDSEKKKMYTAFVSGGTTPYSYEWKINDESQEDYSKSSIYYKENDKIELTVSDNNDCSILAYDIDLAQEFELQANDVYIPAVQKISETEQKFNLDMSLDLAYGDADSDKLNGSVFEVSYFESVDDAMSDMDELPNELVTSRTEVIAKISNYSPCFELAVVNLTAVEYCLLVSEACDNTDPVLLVPTECNSASTPLPDNGTFEIYKVESDGTLTLTLDALVEIDGEYYFDTSDREGNFDVIYTYDDNGSTIVSTAFFEVQALNPRFNIDKDSICGNETFFELRANPIGGMISGPGIIDSFISGTNQFYISKVSELNPSEHHYFTYEYIQNNASGLVCTKTSIDSIYVNDFPQVDIELSIENHCFSDDLTISTRDIGNVSITSYEWTDPEGQNVGQGKELTIENLEKEGYYHVTATSSNGCFNTDSILVNILDLPILSCDIHSEISCPSGSNGVASVDIEGVTDLSGFSFVWSNGSTEKDQSGLSAGTYGVTVTSDQGCKDSCTVEVNEPPSFSIDCTSNITPPKCFDSNEGSNVVVVASGGTPPYSYSKNNIDFTASNILLDLYAGDQKVYIRDASGCMDSCFFTVPQATEMFCIATKLGDVTCFDDSDGRASISASGGTAPYKYEWDNGEKTMIAENLDAGSHTVTITDDKGCTKQCTAIITEPAILTCEITVDSNISCSGESDGQATVTAQGGNGNYEYLWSNGATTRTATNLPNGTSTVKVTDDKGCENVCTVNITEPTVLTVDLEGDIVCEGNMTFVKSNPDSRITTFSWSIGSINTGVTLAFTDQMDVKVNAMQANAGINTLVFMGTSDDGCMIKDSINIAVVPVYSAGDDQEYTFCNLDTSAYVVNLWDVLDDAAEIFGTWTAIDPSNSPDISMPDNVDFECAAAGNYIYRYSIQNGAQCDAQSALITITVEDCFDLAIKKTADVQMITSSEPVLFYIDVINQGDVTAFDVEVTDYLEDYFSFDHAKNEVFETANEHDWQLLGNLLTTTIDTLLPQTSKRLKVYLDLDIDAQILQVYNSAEITDYSAILKDKSFKNLPTDEDDEVTSPEETNDDIDDNDNDNQDNPNDDDQFDFEILPLCGSDILEIACNNFLNISMDENCQAFITPDMILEGDNSSLYIMTIKDEFGMLAPNPLTDEYVGQILEVTVIDSCGGNSCWGNIKLEDKTPAVLECQPIYTTCSSSLEPGDAISNIVTFDTQLSNTNSNIPNNNTWNEDYIIDVFGLNSAKITNVAVHFEIDHESVSDLEAYITSPMGVRKRLFVNPGGNCNENNISINIDPKAFLSAVQLSDTCAIGQQTAIQGTYKPSESLIQFNGQDPNGNWIISLSDGQSTNGGTVKEISLMVSQIGGTIMFPGTDLSWVEAGYQLYKIDGLDACSVVEAGYTDSLANVTCESPFEQIIYRKWHVKDEDNNYSIPCTQQIYVYRNGLESVVFPPNYDGIDEPYISCSDVNGVPGISVTGGVTAGLCNGLQMFPPQDVKLDICEKSFKILRTFKVVEWCTGEVLEHTQVIKVLDDQGPELETVSDVTVSTDVFECGADVTLTRPAVKEDCSETFRYKLAYVVTATNTNVPPSDEAFQFDNIQSDGNENDLGISELSVGRYWIRWTVTDDCGNTSKTYHKLVISDQIAPVPVCDEFTVVSVGSDGKISVKAEIFDDGSYDNCGIKTYLARKMTNLCSTQNSFAEEIVFCCEEVGGESVMVEFKVTDFAGNENICMVEVEVQDKLPPYITKCPDDITISCDVDYEDDQITGRPGYIDNCEVISVGKRDSKNLTTCGLGVITRTWTVVDKQGLKNSCIQEITIEENRILKESDIDWPNDHYPTTCNINLDPENLPINIGYPRFIQSPCGSAVSSFKDQRFVNVENACEKILRTWTVIDWCRYNEANPVLGEGWFTHVQLIKLQNEIAPQIDPCSDITVGTFGNCEGPVNLSITATDDCTPVELLTYESTIDLYSDGVADPIYNRTTRAVTHTLPNGVHKVTWKVSDQCRNIEQCSYLVTLEDKKKPTPYCLGSITTTVMDMSGEVELWAEDFNFGSFDNCTSIENLKVSFSDDPADVVKVFSCAHIPDGEANIISQLIWFTDENGNQDACSVEVFLQDNEANICGEDNSKVTVTGRVFINPTTEQTSVTISRSGDDVHETTTDQDGNFEVNGLTKGTNYRLEATNNTGIRADVNTLDLVAIQRHILGLELFTNPLQYVAADINNDESIKPSDLLSLRKVILGLSSEFPNEQHSWRFLPENHNLQLDNALPYDDFIYIENIVNDLTDQNLTGVKIGDIDGAENLGMKSSNIENNLRSNSKVSLYADLEVEHKLGNTIVPIYMNDISIVGLQLTVETSQNIDIATITEGQLEISVEQIAYSDNKVSLAWHDVASQAVNADEPVFYVVLDGDYADVSLNDIRITSAVTDALIFDDAMNGHEVVLDEKVNKNESTTTGKNPFALYQNTPNPFSDYTDISFYVNEGGNYTLSIHDVTGKVLYEKSEEYQQGRHTVKISSNDISATGIMFYELKNADLKDIKKMIYIGK